MIATMNDDRLRDSPDYFAGLSGVLLCGAARFGVMW